MLVGALAPKGCNTRHNRPDLWSERGATQEAAAGTRQPRSSAANQTAASLHLFSAPVFIATTWPTHVRGPGQGVEIGGACEWREAEQGAHPSIPPRHSERVKTSSLAKARSGETRRVGHGGGDGRRRRATMHLVDLLARMLGELTAKPGAWDGGGRKGPPLCRSDEGWRLGTWQGLSSKLEAAVHTKLQLQKSPPAPSEKSPPGGSDAPVPLPAAVQRAPAPNAPTPRVSQTPAARLMSGAALSLNAPPPTQARQRRRHIIAAGASQPTDGTHSHTDRQAHARTHANCRESTTLFDPHPRLYAAPAEFKDTVLLNTRPSMFLLWQHPVTTRLSTAMKRAVRK
ncbi:hypothetical protein PCL_12357 [Purpureocillium lilacinum]|uniref:Uncharacterized protein n=1 Tax=Purpureocillium lilacinum TaxID=33203 RepID=A0A2U3E938_PURLI|nr:hypothetical protein PCL_12357 [Purpureocillium lilacinum]